MLQKEKMFPFPSMPALKGGMAGYPDSLTGELSVSPGDPEAPSLSRSGSCFRLMWWGGEGVPLP